MKPNKPTAAGNACRESLLSLDFEQSVVPLPGLPLLAASVPAGFPSPAANYIEKRLDLNEHLIAHQEASFFVRVDGHSMTGFGIHDGDLLIVDRAIKPSNGCIVVAVLDGDFTIKQISRLPEGILLRAGADGYADILVNAEQDFRIWGVVRWAIHQVWPCPDRSH